MTKYSLLLVTITIVGLFLLQGCDPEPEPPEKEWISIFNGNNLDGWTPKFAGIELGINYKNTFRVEDGLLEVSYENYDRFDDRFGHLFYKQPYSHYKMRAEYRFVGEQISGAPGWAWRNNGLKLHSQPPETVGLDQSSPVSIEVQLLGGEGPEERTTANMCSKGTHVVIDGDLITEHCYNSTSDTYRGDQWVKVTAEVRGGEVVRHYVEGTEVLSYTSPQYDTTDTDAKPLISGDDLLLEEGYIAIQAESHPTHFRKIDVLPLDEED